MDGVTSEEPQAMQVAANHEKRLNSPRRLSALRDAALMDTGREEAFQRATRLATRLLGAPISLLSLVDGERQFFKADTGLTDPLKSRRGTPLSESFCQYVVTSKAPLSVEDARLDPVLKDNGSTLRNGVIAYLGVPLHAPNGQVLGSFCAIDSKPHHWTDEDRETLSDIATMVENEIALRQVAEERQLVVQELNHRVKNLFAVVSGMITMTARASDTPDTMAKALRSRIHALSTAHNLIMPAVTDDPEASASVSLQTLVSMIVEPHLSDPSDHVGIDGPVVQIGGKPVTTLALALHEMATNAAKYGALSKSDGWLEVSWRISEDHLLMDWLEQGVGVPADKLPSTKGFGSRLIEASVTGQLHGAVETKWGDSGIHHLLRIPLSELGLA